MDSSLRASHTNAFTKNELVVISCLIAYPGLSFCNIRQKTCKSISDGAVRGMSFVPVQLEDFFQRRLRFLGILDDVYHPKYMAGLSTVFFIKHLLLSPTGVVEISNFMGIGVKFGVTTSKLSFVFVNRWSLCPCSTHFRKCNEIRDLLGVCSSYVC